MCGVPVLCVHVYCVRCAVLGEDGLWRKTNLNFLPVLTISPVRPSPNLPESSVKWG